MTKTQASVAIGFVAGVSLALRAAAQAPPPPPPPPPPVLADSGPARPAPNPNRPIPIGAAEIRGVVVDAAGGRPLAGAIVTLSKADAAVSVPEPSSRVTVTLLGPGVRETRMEAPQAPSSFTRPAVTDAEGRFVFNALPAGTYSMNATRAAFLTTNYGQTRPGGAGRPIQLNVAQHLVVTLAMSRPAAIEGTVIDATGTPLVNAQVQATRFGVVRGVRRATVTASAGTDDRGRYRLFGLAPGEYVISATPQTFQSSSTERAVLGQASYERAIAAVLGGRPVSQAEGLSIVVPVLPDDAVRAFAPTYYPESTSSALATRVTVDAGAERAGVDITFHPVRVGSMRGTVVGSPGPQVAIQVMLTALDPVASFSGTYVNRARPDGSFVLGSTVPGQYLLTAATIPTAPPDSASASGRGGPPPLTDAERLWARAIVTVDGDDTPPVVLTLQPGRVIAGTVVAAGGGRASAAGVQLSLVAASGATSGPLPTATSNADGRFEWRAVPAGQFTVRAGAVLKSVVIDGQDVLDFPLDVDGTRDFGDVVVTLAERLGQLSGIVTGADGAAADLTAVLVAADRRYWTPDSRRIRSSRADTSGRFSFFSLPAGEYRLAALTDLDPDQLANPDFLADLVRNSVSVTIADAGAHVQNIQVAR